MLLREQIEQNKVSAEYFEDSQQAMAASSVWLQLYVYL